MADEKIENETDEQTARLELENLLKVDTSASISEIDQPLITIEIPDEKIAALLSAIEERNAIDSRISGIICDGYRRREKNDEKNNISKTWYFRL